MIWKKTKRYGDNFRRITLADIVYVFEEELFSAPFSMTLHKFACKQMIYQKTNNDL